MIDDVIDGARAYFQGLADEKRICVVGGVLGYAAMMSVAREPERFRCAVSLNGVSDLLSWWLKCKVYRRDFLTRYIGRLWIARAA